MKLLSHLSMSLNKQLEFNGILIKSVFIVYYTQLIIYKIYIMVDGIIFMTLSFWGEFSVDKYFLNSLIAYGLPFSNNFE